MNGGEEGSGFGVQDRTGKIAAGHAEGKVSQCRTRIGPIEPSATGRHGTACVVAG